MQVGIVKDVEFLPKEQFGLPFIVSCSSVTAESGLLTRCKPQTCMRKCCDQAATTKFQPDQNLGDWVINSTNRCRKINAKSPLRTQFPNYILQIKIFIPLAWLNIYLHYWKLSSFIGLTKSCVVPQRIYLLSRRILLQTQILLVSIYNFKFNKL